ncbi:MAG TPA: CAP domain-containing protein [Sphingomicrobium sp.]|nr:CAP domain-containing protein [Sphingomicrobium sp.]
MALPARTSIAGALIGAAASILIAAPAAGPNQQAALDPISLRLLAAHNKERAQLGIAPLRWDPALAASAASYGPALAAIGGLKHSPRASRPGQRENLWMGTRGAYSPEQMVDNWSQEKRFFRPGVFPAVSTTGDWLDVSHYTTMIWPTTTRVGCAIHSSLSYDYLICRYSPPGNIDGVSIP